METERRATPSEALQKRVNFLEAAIKDGAHRSSRITARQRNIVGVLNGSPVSREELGDRYRVTGERIRALHNKGMRHLWKNSSPQTQEKFPLESILNTRKPFSLHVRERHSEVMGGTSITIRKAMEQGAKNVEAISKATGFSKSKVRSKRKTLREWGVELPTL